jgi:hypothetical protein
MRLGHRGVSQLAFHDVQQVHAGEKFEQMGFIRVQGVDGRFWLTVSPLDG